MISCHIVDVSGGEGGDIALQHVGSFTFQRTTKYSAGTGSGSHETTAAPFAFRLTLSPVIAGGVAVLDPRVPGLARAALCCWAVAGWVVLASAIRSRARWTAYSFGFKEFNSTRSTRPRGNFKTGTS
jgi:hypothetical protein